MYHRHGQEQLVFLKGTVTVEDKRYFDFMLMLNREYFITKIKTNTVYETIRKFELPDGKTDQKIRDNFFKFGRKNKILSIS